MSDRWPDPPPLFDVDDPATLFELDEGGPDASTGALRGQRPAAGSPASSSTDDADAAAVPGSRGGSTASEQALGSPQDAPIEQQQGAHASSGMFDLVAVFDLETTGVSVEDDRVVTAYIGLIDGSGAVLRSHDWLADPGIEIPDGAAAVHGVTTERARADGRPAAEVVTEICDTLRGFLAEGIPLVAYNASYDLSLLQHEAQRHGVEPIADPRPVIDPFIIDKALDRYRKGKRTLDLVAAHYGVALDDAHEASADAIAAGRVAVAIADRFGDELADTLEGIHDQQVAWAGEQAASLTQYFVKIGKLQAGESLDGTWPVR